MNTHFADQAASGRSAAILAVVEWLSGNDCHEIDDAGLIAGLGQRLKSAGLPLDRLTLHLRTLHPDLAGRTLAWSPGGPVEVYDRDRPMLNSAAFRDSPLRRVMDARQPLRTQGHEVEAKALRSLDIFRGHDLSAFAIEPLHSAGSPVSVVCFATTQRGGFGLADRAMIERVLPALRNNCELRALRQVELPVLDILLGRPTAGRHLASQLHGGEVQTIAGALVMFGLTGWENMPRLDADPGILDTLAGHLGRMRTAAAVAGGLVLNADGQTMLAAFVTGEAQETRSAALEAARLATQPDDSDRSGLRVAAALHDGEILIGTVPAASGRELTCFGADLEILNKLLASAIESGTPLLTSAAFSQA
ncbi:adenylate/guanylate cyclase domain-containing protein [Labrys okinawensis]|uniref:adenylate/guanylate cyclase domain-containing protein n=1 Tax=Labrys okinawensis TaxID=346911 RepID=UPI0039BC635B